MHKKHKQDKASRKFFEKSDTVEFSISKDSAIRHQREKAGVRNIPLIFQEIPFQKRYFPRNLSTFPISNKMKIINKKGRRHDAIYRKRYSNH